MRKCRACGGKLRKGVIVMMCDPNNPRRLMGATVCGTCAATAITILPALPANRCACGELASKCSACVETAEDKAKRGATDAKSLAKKLRLRAKAYKAEASHETPGSDDHAYPAGLAAGLEQAADFLEKGAWS